MDLADSTSGSNEARDCCGGFPDLVVCDRAPFTRGLRDAVREMIIEQRESDVFERLRRGGNLREDINAVAVGIDHPLDSSYLAFSTPKPLEQIVFICGVSHHVSAFLLYPHRVSQSMSSRGDGGKREALFRSQTLGERGSVGAKFAPIGVDFP